MQVSGGNLTMGKKKARSNGISARIVKKRSEANGRQKVLRRVTFGIEQGGKQKFMLHGGSRMKPATRCPPIGWAQAGFKHV